MTEARRSFVTFLVALGEEEEDGDEDEDEDEDDVRIPPAAADLCNNGGADKEIVFLAAKRSAMDDDGSHSKDLGNWAYKLCPDFMCSPRLIQLVNFMCTWPINEHRSISFDECYAIAFGGWN